MRVADYVAAKLVEIGVTDVFLVTGGGMMFMTDGLACNPDIHPVPCLHEQAASMAAISYAQYRDGYGACYVTTGCGGTNTVTGVLHAWQDHIPVIFVSGQANRNESILSVKSHVRQVSVQEAEIVPIVASITKFAKTLVDPEETVTTVEQAIYEAKNGCPGPVWIDIPLDVQEAVIEPDKQKHFVPEEKIKTEPTEEEIRYVVSALEAAERPVVILGQGVRIAGARKEFAEFVENNRIPVIGARLGWDSYPRGNELHMGLMDIRGNRAPAFALQNADCILSIGSRLGQATTGYSYALFGRAAKQIIVVDIDTVEHKKGTVRIDKEINADAKAFLKSIPKLHMKDMEPWIAKCLHWKEMMDPELYEPATSEENRGISKHAFMHVYNRRLRPDHAVTTDAGATTEIPMQLLKYTTWSQRYLGSGSQCEMGYALPALVGASVACGKKTVDCIVGDGSLQMNIQELQTVINQKLPVRIFVWNNGGYGTIYGHQKGLFKGRFVGVTADSMLGLPDLKKIAEAYGMDYAYAETEDELDAVLSKYETVQGPVIIDVCCWIAEANVQMKGQMRFPDGSRMAMPQEDMFPFIDRELFRKEMIVEPVNWWDKQK